MIFRLGRPAIASFLAANLMACAHRPQETGTAVSPAAPGLRAIRVNGTVLNYVDSLQPGATDARPPIVLVHGTLGYYGEWRNQVADFSSGRRTISYSRRYHVPNPRVEDGQTYSPQLHAADLTAFIRALHLGPVDLIGSSYGGSVVIELARSHPEMVHALVLAEPAVNLFTTPGAEDSIRKFAAATTSGLDSARALFARGDSIAGMRTFITASTGTPFDSVPAPTRSYFLSQMFELRKEMLSPPDTWLPRYTCADLRPLTMPVLLLIGERTIPIYHRINDHLAACMGGSARLATIPGVGHHMVDNSRAFDAEVLRFLDGIRH